MIYFQKICSDLHYFTFNFICMLYIGRNRIPNIYICMYVIPCCDVLRTECHIFTYYLGKINLKYWVPWLTILSWLDHVLWLLYLTLLLTISSMGLHKPLTFSSYSYLILPQSNILNLIECKKCSPIYLSRGVFLCLECRIDNVDTSSVCMWRWWVVTTPVRLSHSRRQSATIGRLSKRKRYLRYLKQFAYPCVKNS